MQTTLKVQPDPSHGQDSTCSRIEELERWFSCLSSSTLEELTEREVDVVHIRKHVLSLPYKLKREISHIVSEHATNIRKKLNMDKLFVYLDATIWNFIDYSLLEHIIHLFGSSQLKSEMQSYVTELSTFKRQTTVSQLITHWPGRKEMPPTYCEMTAKIDLNPEECTIEELDALRVDLCEYFLPPLSEFALLHYNFEQGSVLLKWLIALDIVPALIQAICTPKGGAFCKVHNIESLSIREVLIYPIPTNDPAELKINKTIPRKGTYTTRVCLLTQQFQFN